MKKCMVACVVAGAAVSMAQASLLVPGGFITPLTNAGLVPNSNNGPILTVPFTSPSNLYSGAMWSQYFNSSANPFGSQNLTFVYALTNDATSSNSIGRFTINGFGSFQTDVVLYGAGFSATPVDAYLADRSSDGITIGFQYLNTNGYTQIGPGQDTRFLIVHTDAPSFAINTVSIIDGDTATATAYVPIPAPGAAALLGLGGLAVSRRRR